MTTINIQNMVQPLMLTNTVTVGLAQDAYSFINTNVKADIAPQPILWFKRAAEIANGQTFTFSTSFKLADITITTVINLTGTPASSRFNITVFATDQNGQTGTAGTLNDVGLSSFQMYARTVQGNKIYFEIIVHRFAKGSFDDVTITLAPVV